VRRIIELVLILAISLFFICGLWLIMLAISQQTYKIAILGFIFEGVSIILARIYDTHSDNGFFHNH